VLKRHGMHRGRLVVENENGEDRMTLRVEGDSRADATTVEATLRDVMKVRGEVSYVPAGSLPNDGKVIEDARKYG
jgi:hypothetical protein